MLNDREWPSFIQLTTNHAITNLNSIWRFFNNKWLHERLISVVCGFKCNHFSKKHEMQNFPKIARLTIINKQLFYELFERKKKAKILIDAPMPLFGWQCRDCFEEWPDLVDKNNFFQFKKSTFHTQEHLLVIQWKHIFTQQLVSENQGIIGPKVLTCCNLTI